MQSVSLIHSCAWALAATIFDIVSPCIRDEEKQEAFQLFAKAAQAALEHYEATADRMSRRIHPSLN
ncbi:hypothetical protein [Zavarzinella formosa]|uniref:hypothetical protein n=1 Tax=Zavarzinella formosa TaxID=360055 RepID=UPI0002F4C2CC|nr:hypothetical protein [Zavarzinella formosa]